MGNFPKPSRSDWESAFHRELKLEPGAKSYKETADGIHKHPLYDATDLADLEHLGSLPGFPPFVRGPHASMYRGRPWTVRQYAGFSTAAESNRFYRQALDAGQTGLSVAFDLPTHRGYDSHHPRAEGDVGMAGVAIDSVEDMKILFDGIPLNQVSVSMTMNGAVLPILAMYIVAAREQGVAESELSGTVQNDILKEFLVRNTYVYPPEQSMRIVADIIAYTSQRMPRYNPVSISGYHMQEAGATPAQELAYTIADGLEYVNAAIAAGLNVDDFAPRLSFFFGIGMDFFSEVAKLRAARLLWARLMNERFQPKNPRSLMLRTHCQTSGVSLTAQTPHNNVVRVTLQALAAILGGTQSLHTNSFDEALALPTEFSASLARATQHVLREESGVTDVIDPLGGSYFVERMTGDLVDKALELIHEIDELGGMTQAVKSGLPKRRIEEAAAARQARIDRGDEVIVGVNKYTEEVGEAIDIRRINNDEVLGIQKESLDRLFQQRDQSLCESSLAQLRDVASTGDGNLLKVAIEAAANRATVGEISNALETAFGRYTASTQAISGVYGHVLKDDPQFQDLRERTARFLAKHGRRPRMLVCKFGQDGHDRGAKVIAAGFADVGFDIDIGALFQMPEEAVREAMDNDVHAVGVSSQAAGHMTLIPRLLQALRDNHAEDIIVFLGGVVPEDDAAALRDCGVAAVFGPGTPVLSAASDVLDMIEDRAK